MTEPHEPPRRRLGTLLAPVRLMGRGLGKAAGGVGTIVRQPLKLRRGAHMASVTGQLFREHPEPEEQNVFEQWSNGVLERVTSPLGLLHKRRQATSQAAMRDCFPQQLCPSQPGILGASCQALAAVGGRTFGGAWLGAGPLKIRIYDFAVYMNTKQAKQSDLSKQYQGHPTPAPQEAQFFRQLRSAEDIEMSLVVRASRSLPIRMMSSEYERILKRRLGWVGGSPNDAGLTQVLEAFREDRLPASVKQGSNVRKGAVLTFTRDTSGRLTAKAGDEEIVSVRSPPLCAALFDLYLGDQPVSKAAREAAGDSFGRMVGDAEYVPPQGKGVCAAQACLVA